jgi:DNA replication protein DnaC
MLIALGTEAAMKGYRVCYTLATKLVNELVEAADEKQLNKTTVRYGRVDLLCIDLCRDRDYAERRVGFLGGWRCHGRLVRHSDAR